MPRHTTIQRVASLFWNKPLSCTQLKQIVVEYAASPEDASKMVDELNRLDAVLGMATRSDERNLVIRYLLQTSAAGQFVPIHLFIHKDDPDWRHGGRKKYAKVGFIYLTINQGKLTRLQQYSIMSEGSPGLQDVWV